MSFYIIKVINKNSVLSVSVYKIKPCSVAKRKKHGVENFLIDVFKNIRINGGATNKCIYIIKSSGTSQRIKKLYGNWLHELCTAANIHFKHIQENGNESL